VPELQTAELVPRLAKKSNAYVGEPTYRGPVMYNVAYRVRRDAMDEPGSLRAQRDFYGSQTG